MMEETLDARSSRNGEGAGRAGESESAPALKAPAREGWCVHCATWFDLEAFVGFKHVLQHTRTKR